ncbi:MAG: DUF6290 family protein [Peptostreptococcaceae bacterium]|nr:DUF6290 family protein [Peptostreptococcaceae bacterium]
MHTISITPTDREWELIHSYVKENNLNLSSFVLESILDRIEEDTEDEKRILKSLQKARQEESYDHTEVWKMLGI